MVASTRLTGPMTLIRQGVLIVGLVSILTGCGLFGGSNDAVPPGDQWREDVVAAIEGAPGVQSASVTVDDVDSGTGHRGPVLQGSMTVTGGEQALAGALTAASEVLGEASDGVRINLRADVDGQGFEKIGALGYPATNGRALWEATH